MLPPRSLDSYGGDIIALSAHAMPRDRENALRAGCNAYISKPINRRLLLARVLRHVRKSAAEMAFSD